MFKCWHPIKVSKNFMLLASENAFSASEKSSRNGNFSCHHLFDAFWCCWFNVEHVGPYQHRRSKEHFVKIFHGQYWFSKVMAYAHFGPDGPEPMLALQRWFGDWGLKMPH